MRKMLISFGWLCILAVPTAYAEPDRATAEEVFTKVHEAVRLLVQDGDAALSVIADPSGGFMWKDSYVFVVDCDADRVIVNPAFPERVGGDIKQHTDYAGKQYGLELCETAAVPGGGWVEYVWLRVGGDEPRRKISFVTSVPGTLYSLGAGIYDDESSVTDLLMRTESTTE